MKSIGERIKSVRKNLGLSQVEFAKGINISRQQIGLLEKDERTLTDRTLNDMVREYGISRDYILTGEGEMFMDLDKSSEIVNYIRELCENDQEKADLVIETYKMFIDLSTKDKKIINALVKSLVEKKHPKE